MQKFLSFTSRVILPVLLLLGIATETYLKLKNSSLCEAEGCKLAGELLQFDPLYLNYAGMLGLLLLSVFGYLSLKDKRYNVFFFMTLYGAIAFEATILAYQVVANPEPCLFCLTVFSSLILIALLSSFRYMTILLSMLVSIMVAFNVLAITKNQAFVSKPGYYLIQSETCPHCIKVKKYLKAHNITYTGISTSEASARSFLKFVDTSTIPVLIRKEKSYTTIITGDHQILAHFEAKKPQESSTEENATLPQSNNSTMPELSSDFLSSGADDGCSLSVIQAPSCEDDNKSAE